MENELFDIAFDELMKCLENGYGNVGMERILGNENVPFAYCEKAMSAFGRKLSNDIVEAIVMRKDCPSDVIEWLFDTDDVLFISFLFSMLVYKKKDFELNRRIERKLLEKDCCISILKNYFIDDEDIQRELLHKIMRSSNVSVYLHDFAMNNVTIPDDCWGIVDIALGKASKADFIDQHSFFFSSNVRAFDEMMLHFDFMRKPFDESNLDERLSDRNIGDSLLVLKMAYNPSISDYAITQLMMRLADSEFLSDVSKVIEACSEKREEWRNWHFANKI